MADKTKIKKETPKKEVKTKTNKDNKSKFDLNKYVEIIKKDYVFVLLYYILFPVGYLQSFMIRKKDKDKAIIYLIISILGMITYISLYFQLRYKV